MKPNRIILTLASLGIASFSAFAETGGAPNLKENAERYFQAVYEGDLPALNKLATDDIVISYPIFETIFGKRAIRGIDGVRAFSKHFSSKWVGREFAINEEIQQGDTVVLVWQFRARDSEAPTNKVRSWGGISVIHFNADGKVVSEVGEESSPGPVDRLKDENGEPSHPDS